VPTPPIADSAPTGVVDEVQPAVDQTPTKKHPDGTDCHMPPIDETGQPQQHRPECRDDQRQPDIRRRSRCNPYEKWSLAFQALTVGIVAAYTYYASEQWRANRDAADAARDAAAAAVANNVEQRRANEIDERAWIVPRVMRLIPDRPDYVGPLTEVGIILQEGDTRVSVSLENMGKTVAFNVAPVTRWKWHPEDLPRPDAPLIKDTVAFSPPSKERAPAVGLTLGPFSEADLQDISTQRKTLYVGGFILYDDPAGTGRWTRWCALYDPRSTDFRFCPPGFTEFR
jgi:hypothetical protein